MATVNLTEGAIAAICAAEGSVDLQPVVQVADIRKVNTRTTNITERYRVLLSDGVHTQQGMLATQKNGLVNNGELQLGSIVQLNQFICNNIHNRKIIIICDLEVLKQTCPLIGVAKSYIPRNASVPPSVGQAEANPAHVRRGNSHATGPDPTYLASEAGRLLQPKLESAAQLQSYGNIVGSEPTSREKDLAVRCFKCQGFGHFQSVCPNKRTVTLREAISLRNELYSEACDEEALFLAYLEAAPKIVPVAPTVTLSEGSIAALCSDDRESDMKPVIQIADIRQVTTRSTIRGETGTIRYRLLLSDGVHVQQGMLATQHNDLVRNGHLQKGSLVQLLDFICNKLQNRMIIIVTKLEVLQEKFPLIGEPKPYQP